MKLCIIFLTIFNLFFVKINLTIVIRLKNVFKFINTKKQKVASPSTNATPGEELLKCVDLIGPADKISNLRKYHYYIPEDESKLELDFRLMREKINAWNHEYWTQQNLKFVDSITQ